MRQAAPRSANADEALPQGVGDRARKPRVARRVRRPTHDAAAARETAAASAGSADGGDVAGGNVVGQPKPDLAPAGQFDIDLREQLRVEQGAMLDALRAIDPEAAAQGVEAVLGAGMAGAREASVSTIRVMQTGGRPQLLSSWLRKPKSNPALCATSGESPMKSSNSSTLSAKRGLSDRKIGAQPVDRLGLARHRGVRG